MAHFARIDDKGIVVDVHVVKNCAIGGCVGPNDLDYQRYPEQHAECGSLDFPDTEPIGQRFLSSLYGNAESEYVQCSYNSKFRGGYPGYGWHWDGTNFISNIPVE